jgi:hypothetical protein
MYSSEDEDLERFYFQYQTEALPHGESLQSFCVNQMIKSIIYLLKTGDSDRNREKDDYDGSMIRFARIRLVMLKKVWDYVNMVPDKIT